MQGVELKQRVLGHPDLQTTFGGSTLSALQNSYSLSVSYAQARSTTPGDQHQPARADTDVCCVLCQL